MPNYRLQAIAFIVMLIPVLFMQNAASADEINVRFAWKYSGGAAYFFLGNKLGLYKDAGVTMKMGEGAGAPATLGTLIQGQDDVGIMPATYAISAIQKGMPVRIIALYNPATGIVLISHPDNPVNVPKDLEGKSIARSDGEVATAYLDSFCEINKIDCALIKKINMNSQMRLPQFLQNQVDVIGLYASNDIPVLEDKTGIHYPSLDLASYGIAIPGNAVVASEAAIQKKGPALRKFLTATAKSIEATRKDPEAAAAALQEIWKGGPSRNILVQQIKITMSEFKSPEGKPTGWVDEKVMENTLKLVAKSDGIDDPKPISAFYTNELLQ